MQLFIQDMPADIKAGTSIDYTLENSLINQTSEYTLSISLPLDTANNRRIFGHLWRTDTAFINTQYAARLIARNFNKTGIITILEATDTEVKAQFLEGEAAANASGAWMDEVYINDMQLPSFIVDTYHHPDDEQSFFEAVHQKTWINENTKEISTKGAFPFLVHVAEWLLENAPTPYSAQLFEWHGDLILRRLVFCNILKDYSRSNLEDRSNIYGCLPHWSYREFFNQLEILLGGVFLFDHINHTCTLRLYKNTYNKSNLPVVQLDNILQQHTRKTQKAVNTILTQTIKYNAPDHPEYDYKLYDIYSNYLSCSETTIPSPHGTVEGIVPGHDTNYYLNSNCVVLRSSDALFFKKYKSNQEAYITAYEGLGTTSDNQYVCRVHTLGSFTSEPGKKTVDCKFVPAIIKRVLLNDFSNGYRITASPLPEPSRETNINYHGFVNAVSVLYDDGAPQETEGYNIMQTSDFIKSKREVKCAFSVISVALLFENDQTERDIDGGQYGEPWFVVEKFNHGIIADTDNGHYDAFLVPAVHRAYTTQNIQRFDTTEVLTVSFLSRTIPSPDNIFIINNQKFVCNKLQTTIDAQDKDFYLIKGEFYRAVEN